MEYFIKTSEIKLEKNKRKWKKDENFDSAVKIGENTNNFLGKIIDKLQGYFHSK